MSFYSIRWLLFYLLYDPESFLYAGGRETEMILTKTLTGLQSTWISILINAYICYRNPKRHLLTLAEKLHAGFLPEHLFCTRS